MISKRNTLVLLAMAMVIASGAVQAAATGSFAVTPVTEARGSAAGLQTWSVVPQGPGWLPLPRLEIVLPGVTGPATLLASAGSGEPWREVDLVDGRGSLPFPLPNAAALWEVRLRTADSLAAPPQIVPVDPLVLTSEGPVRAEAPALVTVTRWGESAWLKVRAVDAVGAPLSLETLAGADAGADPEGWHDLGHLNGADQGSLRVYLTPDVSFPVLVEAQTDAGETGVLVLAPENLLAGAADQIHYYGMAKPNWNCATRVYDGTYLWIVGIEDGTTYTVTDLDTSSVLATGTVNRGQKATLVSPNPTFVDNHRFRLATSRPVQASMGFDCSGTLPGSMFFLADDGRSMYGSAFTVPVGGLDGRARYVVFAAGAGTAEIRTISGTLVDSHTFTAAGYWDATASLTANTVYAVTSSGTIIAVQQSSQNTATEVPPVTMVVGGGTCAPSSLGNKFYVHVQDWNGVDPALVAIGYSDVDWRYRLLPSGSWNNTTVRVNNTRRRTVAEGFYEVEVTTAGGTIGLLAGSYEGGTEIYDLGDDSVYYRGTGSNIRGHALRCGGAIFVAQDGTYLDETGATTTPALPATFDAGDVISLSGNTSSATPFRIYSQDSSHSFVVEVFGGNCSTNLNDWSKVMLPAALDRPVITYPDASGYLNDLTPTVTGTAVPGATVTLRVYDHSDGDSLVFTGTATVASDGTWSLEVTTTLTENHLYYFEAIQGLDGACPVDPLPPPGSSGSQGEIDTTPPAAPVITGPADGSVTDDPTPTITGTAEANCTVTVCIAAECHTTLADASGNWTLDWPTPLADGPHTVSATATDAAGNVSPAASNGFTVDTTPPAAPVVASITTDTGSSSSDGITSDNTLAFSGTAEAGSTVHVFLDGVEIGTTVADGSGTWSFDYTGTTLADGPYSLTATAVDGAGNTSPASAPFAVLVDTASPAAPTVTPLTTNDTTPALHGTLGAALEAGDVFTVVVNGITYTAGDGNLVVSGTDWTLTVPAGSELTEGTYAVTATVTDAAGNSTSDASTNELLIDTTPPAAPTVTPLTTNDTTPALHGTLGAALGAGDAFTVVVNGITYTTGDGNLVVSGTDWTLTVPAGNELTEGTYAVTAAVTDAAGNSTSDASTNELVIDTTPPAAPTVTPLTTNDTTPALHGTLGAALEAGDVFTVVVNGITYTAGDGNLVVSGTDWTLTIPAGSELTEGTYAVTATVTDAAGNSTSDASTNELVIDTAPPAAPAVTPLTTNDTTPALHGTLGAALEAGDVFTVVVNGITYTAGDGNLVVSGTDWALTIPAGSELTEGTYAVTATVTDAAGNSTSDASTNELVIDLTSPAAPTVTPLTTNDTTPALHGTLGAALEAGDVFTVVVNGITYTTGDGNLVVSGTDWTLTVPAGNELTEGTYAVTAAVTDAAGNSTSDASTNELVIDTTPPAVTITAPAEGSTTGDSTPAISGTTDAAEGSTVTVTIGAESHTATVQADGSWSLDWPTPLADASYTVSASLTDPAGNPGSDSNGFTVLATPPGVPPIVTSPLYAGASVTVYGSSVEAPGSLVTVYVGGVSAGTALVQADGSWSLAGVALADGQVVTATVEAAGKLVSGVSNAVVVASGSGDLTPAPVITTPVAAGATSVTGTALPGASVDVYADGYYLGTTIADGSGAWTLSSLAPLPDGTLLSATATLAPGGTSSWSNTVVVGTAIHLLRSDDLTSLSQPIAPLFERRYPAFSSMAAMGPNHTANWGEGADPTLPGTSDDDKAYVRGITSGTAEPDATVLADNGRPLVFYELVDNGQKTLYLTKSGGNIVFTFTP